MDILQEYSLHEFKGDYPDVPLADGVNLSELKETDESPMFVTLPIIPEIGATSGGGLLYDKALAESIVRQINEKRPPGIYGHLKDRHKDFPKAEAFWVGAKEHNNSVWAKAYVPPGAARDDIRRKKAIGGKIASSIYGTAKYEQVKPGVRRAATFNLESVDFAPPERASLGYGATPHITAEIEQEINDKELDMNKTELLAELTVDDVPGQIRDSIIAEYKANNKQTELVSELEQQLSDKETVIETLQNQLASVQAEKFEAVLDGKVEELIDWRVKGDDDEKKVEAFKRMLRGRIVSELNEERDNLDEVAEMVWEDMKPLAETLRDALAGPPAIVKGNGRVRDWRKLDDSPEARRNARARVGI